MDLPTCPACQQSVLDEDAVECPFCGAPMKGGAAPARPPSAPKPPVAKTGPSKSAPAKSEPGAPAAGNRPGSSARPKDADEAAPAAADDDPFGVDHSVAANAIPVSRQGGGAKTLEVTCPMCETTGFVSPKAAGKQVKCCNPQCM